MARLAPNRLETAMSAEISDETPKPPHPALLSTPNISTHDVRTNITHSVFFATEAYVHSDAPNDPAATTALAALISAAADYGRVGVEVSRNNRARARWEAEQNG